MRLERCGGRCEGLFRDLRLIEELEVCYHYLRRVWIFSNMIGEERIEAMDSSEEQFALRAFMVGKRIKGPALHAPVDVIGVEGAQLGIELGEPPEGAQPEGPLLVPEHAVHDVMGDRTVLFAEAGDRS